MSPVKTIRVAVEGGVVGGAEGAEGQQQEGLMRHLEQQQVESEP